MKKVIYPQSYGTSHILPALALGIAASMSQSLHAADVTAPGKLDAASGLASGAEQLKAGEWTVRAEAESAKKVDLSLSSKTDDKAEVSQTDHAALKVGTALTDRWQLTLGAHGSKATVKTSDQGFAGDEAADLRRDKGGFSGGSLDLRYRLTDGYGFFNSSISAGAETGAKEKADQSLVRASVPAYRLGLGLSFGSLLGSHVNVDVGYRARQDDRLMSTRLGSDAMAALSAKWFFLDNLGLDTGFAMRQVQVRYLDADGRDKTQALSGGYYQAGLLVRGGGWQADVHGGQRLAQRGFGFGQSFMGIGVAYTFGAGSADRRDDKAAAVKADAVKSERAVKTEEAKGPLGEKEPVSLEKLYDDLSKQKGGNDPDEFEAYDVRVQKEKAMYGEGPDKSDVVEQELEELRAIEKKTAEENARREKAQEEADRRERLKYQKDSSKQRLEMEESVRKELDRIDSVTDEEASWRGLE